MATAKDIMVKKVITISETSSMHELSDILVKKKMSGLPVINKNKKLVGFVSEKEIITSFSLTNSIKKKTRDIMVRNVVTVDKDTHLEEISKIFSEKPIRCLPVLDGEKLVGIVLRKTVVNKLLGSYY